MTLSAAASRPDFTVVIPTYNRARTLPDAVASVLTQSSASVELVVVDDGSTDETAEWLATVGDPRLKVVRQPNRGRCAARNAGAAHGRGRHLIFLDSDDVALPGWLEQHRRALADQTVAIACCGLLGLATDARGGTRYLGTRLPRQMGGAFGWQTGLFITGTFSVDAALFRRVGGYDEGLAAAETTELALRLVPRCLEEERRIASIPVPLVCYRNPRAGRGLAERDARERLQAASFILARHGERLRTLDPPRCARYSVIAGVNAARLGQPATALRHFRAAVRAQPTHWRHYGRLGLALVPPLARRFWWRSRAVPQSPRPGTVSFDSDLAP
jgi:glycosyltransferase involved in cell wall biosynthesis